MTKNIDRIPCPECHTHFAPTDDQSDFIQKAIAKGITLIMLTCQQCRWTVPINPLALLSEQSDCQNIHQDTEQVLFRTPISGCHGYVSYIKTEEQGFYGCGETGVIWYDKDSLFRDIDAIIKQYPHRSLCYSRTKSGWVANANEPSNMSELIDQESWHELTDYRQG